MKLLLRIQLGWWAFWNPNRLTMLHFNMLRDSFIYPARQEMYDAGIHGQGERQYCKGRADGAALYVHQLRDMPGIEENWNTL